MCGMSLMECAPFVYRQHHQFSTFTPHHLFCLTLIGHPPISPCCVGRCLASFLSAFSLKHTCCLSIRSEALLMMHISQDITTCDFLSLRYHCQPYDSICLHSFPYFLHLICESDIVIYNSLAQDLQIGIMVVEIMQGLCVCV